MGMLLMGDVMTWCGFVVWVRNTCWWDTNKWVGGDVVMGVWFCDLGPMVWV